MTRLCMHQMSLRLPCNLLWTESQPPVRVVRCKLFVDKQCQDGSPSDWSLQVRFWLNFEWFWRYQTPSIRILDVELDSMLNFIEHISSQLKKAYAKTGALRRIRHFVPVDVMLALYKSFILPHLEYCIPLLLGVGKVQANKIEDANHYILRTLTGHGKSLSYQELLNICKLNTLECRKKQQSLILLFKCIRNIGPKYIRDFFSIRETSCNLWGNGVNLCVPKFNLNFMRNSFTYKCAQLWNKLPKVSSWPIMLIFLSLR